MPTTRPPPPRALLIIDMINAQDSIRAHMRGFDVQVPADWTASPSVARRNRSLALMRDSLQIDTHRCNRIRLQ